MRQYYATGALCRFLETEKKMKSKWGCHLCVCITRRLTIKYLLPLFSPKDKSFEKKNTLSFFHNKHHHEFSDAPIFTD